MDKQPVARRRPRPPRAKPSNAPPRQTFKQTVLVIVTDDPAFIEPQLDDGREVFRWNAAKTGSEGGFSGDPSDSDTYTIIRNRPHVSAVVALRDGQQNEAAARAIHQMNQDVAILLVGDTPSSSETRQLAQHVDSRAALSLTLEEELRRLETLMRVRALREFAEEEDVVPILVHKDPDPDALASALAIRTLLRRPPDETPVLTLDEMTRPENRRMADLLELQVTQVTREELLGFNRIICTDVQPREQFESAGVELAVIDHHPVESGYDAEYVDIRPRYGATATILTEYLRADDERHIGDALATGLVYAIKTDTDGLSRGVHPADVAAYTFLLERADPTLLRRIERPSLSEETARAYGCALSNLVLVGELAVAYMGELPVDQSHILADLADTGLAIEHATWAAAGALVEGNLVITLRRLGGSPGAGDLARRLASRGGSGGGHETMARAVLPLDAEWGVLKDAPLEVGRDLLVKRVTEEVEQLR
ncbi:MAG: DHH family phosphoesterase [Gemmatimonadota bacterium]